MISTTELKSVENLIHNKFDYLTQKAKYIQANSDWIYWSEKAIEHFGTTTKPHEAGFILYDGQMLDFSGGYKDEKRLDHAEIQQIYTEEELIKANRKYKAAGIIHLFQLNSNSIRLNSAQFSGYMYISMYDTNKVTQEQIKTLEYITHYDTEKHIIYDVYNKDSRAITYGEAIDVQNLINKLRNYVQ